MADLRQISGGGGHHRMVTTIDGTNDIVTGSMIQMPGWPAPQRVMEILASGEAVQGLRDSTPRGHLSKFDRFILRAAQDRIMSFGGGVVLLRTPVEIVALTEDVVVRNDCVPDRHNQALEVGDLCIEHSTNLYRPQLYRVREVRPATWDDERGRVHDAMVNVGPSVQDIYSSQEYIKLHQDNLYSGELTLGPADGPA